MNSIKITIIISVINCSCDLDFVYWESMGFLLISVKHIEALRITKRRSQVLTSRISQNSVYQKPFYQYYFNSFFTLFRFNRSLILESSCNCTESTFFSLNFVSSTVDWVQKKDVEESEKEEEKNGIRRDAKADRLTTTDKSFIFFPS